MIEPFRRFVWDGASAFGQWLADASPWVPVAIGLGIGASLGAWLAGSWFRRQFARKGATLRRTMDGYLSERNKVDAVLTDLELGILAFSGDGNRISANPAAYRLLDEKYMPDSLADFLARYGEDNGLRANVALGIESQTVTTPVKDRVLRIRMKSSRMDRGARAGTVVILQDITESEQQEAQRKAFVANVSHELKTPLTTIKTYSESLLEWGLEEKKPPAVRKDIQRIHDDAIRMECLVEDLLLLSSIDSRRARPPMEQLDFTALVRMQTDRMQDAARAKDIRLDHYVLARVPDVFAERVALERILSNLVSNAIKYTENGGSVTVYVGYLVDDVYVKVSDTGVGIDDVHLPRIFERFYRVDMTGSRMFGGTGLGLSIAKELTELHGGVISVTSALGKGTDVVVRIPTAGKVFRDLLDSVGTGVVRTEPLYMAAAAELSSHLEEAGLGGKTLDTLGDEEKGRLLSFLLDRAEPEGPSGKTMRRTAERIGGRVAAAAPSGSRADTKSSQRPDALSKA